MFELFDYTDDKEYGFVFDSNDFSVEKHSKDSLFKYMNSGIKIKGIILRDSYIKFREVRKSIIYSSGNLVVIDSSIENEDHLRQIQFYTRGCGCCSYMMSYNDYVAGYLDKITPKVTSKGNDIYQIDLFGKNTGWSFCVVNLGNGVIKPIYRDTVFVPVASKLDVNVVGSNINITRSF